MKLVKELQPVLDQLTREGYDVYSYEGRSLYGEQVYRSLFWYEGGRVLNIQCNSWYNAKCARERFDLNTSYIPSQRNGSGCGLTQEDHDTGVEPSEILNYRNRRTY